MIKWLKTIDGADHASAYHHVGPLAIVLKKSCCCLAVSLVERVLHLLLEKAYREERVVEKESLVAAS